MSLIPSTAKSWISVLADSHFPIQNIPLGLASLASEEEVVVTRIGDSVIDLCELAAEGVIPEEFFPAMHCMMDVDRADVTRLRSLLFELFEEANPRLRDNLALREAAIHSAADCQMLMPMEIPQFVDFYAGIQHASNVGRMFRPDMEPLLPNYRHLPVGYNGRASSIRESGVSVVRPNGQYKPADSPGPVFGPTRELDFELELGFFIGVGNEPGEPISVEEAEDHILGCVLVNDWSARDVQRWEYQPLGPFLAKSFATTISPWIVSLDALAPFRVDGPAQEPEPLPHLRGKPRQHFDVHLEVSIQTAKMTAPQVISSTNSRELYWSFAQMIAHQTSNGTPIEPGDLYASGTISGPDKGSFGSMLELAWKGTEPITMAETGELRAFIEDGDTVTMTGYCQGDGYRVGFGELTNLVVAD